MHGVKPSMFGILGALMAAGCGPSDVAAPGGADAAVGDACTGTDTRCHGVVYQVCEAGVFVDQEICADACAPELGCVACRPDRGTACQGDDVHACNPDGTLGARVETCAAGTCNSGRCVASSCADGAELIYVVDDEYRLLSFDPRALDMGQDPFTLIGPLSCPTWADSYSGWGDPPTPFSMSVDRDATAWVLYTNGELFHVSTEDASCAATSFARGQLDFQLFGMGFVTDEPGSSEERLWIAGGPGQNGQVDVGDLGFIDKRTLEVSYVGALPDVSLNSPELTGTGDAMLFGYYPNASADSVIARIAKRDASHDGDMTWALPALGTSVSAWAFAHWGGDFYIFVTTNDAGGQNTRVLHYDPDTDQVTTELAWQPYRVVGAGVSTCAPIVVN